MESRFLDAKLTVFGLEPDEFICFLGPFMLFYFMDLLFVGLILGAFFAFTIKKVKSGKPEGYLMHLLYKLGVPFPGLIPPHITHFEE